MRQARNYHAGLAAEDMVLRSYQSAGYTLRARRFRGLRGEIDLVLGQGEAVIFVEVKKSKNFEGAIARIGPGQIARIYNTANEYLGTQPMGLLTEARFDVALVNSYGEVKVLENALCQ